MADIKKFLDQAGVSTLWTRVAQEVAKEKTRAEAAELANANAAKKAQEDVDTLKAYVGTIPESYTESNIVAFIQKRAQEILAAAQGGSSETAASVKAALDEYKAENDPKVQANTDDIATIKGDYLKSADKTELAGNIATNASEIARIDNALKAAIENNGEGLDSIKELAYSKQNPVNKLTQKKRGIVLLLLRLLMLLLLRIYLNMLRPPILRLLSRRLILRVL